MNQQLVHCSLKLARKASLWLSFRLASEFHGHLLAW